MNFEDYIIVTGDNENFETQVKQVLEHIASTPEGQAIIENAFDLNDNQRINIKATTDGIPWSLSKEGTITLGEQNIAESRYQNAEKDGYSDFSLNRAVFHELVHMSDPEFHKFHDATPVEKFQHVNQELSRAYQAIATEHYHENNDDHKTFSDGEAKQYVETLAAQSPEIRETLNDYIQNNAPHELLAIEKTNAFMDTYFNETPRGDYNKTDMEGTPELEIRTAQTLNPLNI